MPQLSALLDASPFEGLAITKTPDGYAVSLLGKGIGDWSPDVSGRTASEAILAALAPVLPPCPVPLP